MPPAQVSPEMFAPRQTFFSPVQPANFRSDSQAFTVGSPPSDMWPQQQLPFVAGPPNIVP